MEPSKHKSILRLAAMASMGVLTAEQKKTLMDNTTSDAFVDLKFLKQVELTKAALRKRSEKKQRQKKAKAAPAAPAPAPVVNWDAHRGDDNIYIRIGRPGGESFSPDPEYRVHVSEALRATGAQLHAVRRYAKLAELRNAASDGVAVDGGDADEDEMDIPNTDDFAGPQLVPKVQFTVTVITQEGGSHNDPYDVVGLYCRFLVRDPHINTGTFLTQMLRNVETRVALQTKNNKRGNVGGGGPADRFRELWPHYGCLQQSNHPAGNWLTKEVYYQACVGINEALEYGKMRQEVFTTMNVSNPSSPMHLANLLTTERAVEDMRKAGAAHVFLAHDWRRGPETASYPNPECGPTFMYHPNSVFWVRGRYVGMSEQMFPHIDPNSDLLVSMLNGENLDTFIQASYERQAEADAFERQMRSSYSEMRNVIEQNWLVPRKLVLDCSLVHYNTNNDFVHRAAEAEVINKRVAKERPPHSAETYRHFQKLMAEFRTPVGTMASDYVELVERTSDDLLATFMERTWNETNRTPRYQYMFGNQLTPSQMAKMLCADAPLKDRVREYARYSRLMRKSQAACMRTFVALFPLEGDTNAVSISDPIRVILRWYAQNKDSKFPHMTRRFVMWDPHLDVFGNSTVRMCQIYSLIGKVLNPIVCLISEGLFSCYRYSPNKLAFNMMLHGRYDVGKTFTAIQMLREFTSIEGGLAEFTSATQAADTTLKHVYDLIIVSDEVAKWKVNSREADKFPDLVSREKVKLTRRQVGHRVFTNEMDPDGNPVRWTQLITTDHYSSLIEVTNHVVEATDALASRYFRMTVAVPHMPARLLKGYMGAGLSGDSRLYLQINQFLSAAIYKATQCGGLLEPDLELFEDLSNGIIEALISSNAMTVKGTERTLEIMTPYVIQLIYRVAIHCVFDMPFSEYYEKEFRAEYISAVQRYLYSTVPITVWAWTALGSSWIEENNSSFITACCTSVGISWPDGVSPYAMYECDIPNLIPWRVHENTAFRGKRGTRDATGDEWLVDLQYITLKGGSPERIFRDIADCTKNPHLDWTDVAGIINILSSHQVSIPGGGYEPQPAATFRQWHRYTVLPSVAADGTPVDGQKHIDLEGNTENRQLPYTDENPNTREMRTEDDVPRYPADKRFPAVDDSELRTKNQLHIMPHIANMFRSERIVQAIISAIATRSTRPGKYLMGIPNEQNPMHMRTLTMTQERIDEIVEGMDADMVASGGTADPEYQNRPVPRSVGIAFNRCGGISKADSVFFTYAPMIPVRNGDDSWAQRTTRELSNLQRVREVSVDLDYDSALRQHVRIGMPLEEPVHSPAYIVEALKRACAERGVPYSPDIDYPHDLDVEIEKRQVVWNSSRNNVRPETAVVERNYSRIMEDSSRPRKETTRRQIEEQTRKKREREAVVPVPSQPQAPVVPPRQRAPKPKKKQPKVGSAASVLSGFALQNRK